MKEEHDNLVVIAVVIALSISLVLVCVGVALICVPKGRKPKPGNQAYSSPQMRNSDGPEWCPTRAHGAMVTLNLAIFVHFFLLA